MSTPEADVVARVRLAVGALPGVRVFRNNIALAWVGEVDKIRSRMPKFLVINYPRVLHAGLHPGSADLIGIQTVTVVPDMIGQKLGRFLSLECKTDGGRVMPEQQTWLDFVRVAGGVAGIVRTPEDALNLVKPNGGEHA